MPQMTGYLTEMAHSQTKTTPQHKKGSKGPKGKAAGKAAKKANSLGSFGFGKKP